jgi:hypothetical protein
MVNMGLDGIGGGDVHNALISGNWISLKIPPGQKHSDGIQFWNVARNENSTNLTIEDNKIRAHNQQSHGIYMANAAANGDGGAGTFFKNVIIRDNKIITGDGLGLSWGQTDNLDIHRNIIIKDPTLPQDNGTVPSIRVHTRATDVSVTHNVGHKAPQAADANWQTVKHSGGGWNIDDNPIIRVGASVNDAIALLARNTGAPAAAAAAAEAPAATLFALADDAQGDTFRFDAAGKKTDVVTGFGFDQGDRIVLHDYAENTFRGEAAEITLDGTAVTITSLDELRALDAASPRVKVREGDDDTLIIHVRQPGPDHAIYLADLAHEYF